jgi:hypothetical protein
MTREDAVVTYFNVIPRHLSGCTEVYLERSVLDRSNNRIRGSNPVRGWDVCPLLAVLVEALRRADPPSKEVKVNLSLCLTKHHAMMAYYGWRYSATHSLTLAREGGERSPSCRSRFSPWERPPRYPLDRRLGGVLTKYLMVSEVNSESEQSTKRTAIRITSH